MSEGALRNTHLEISRVRNGIGDLMKLRAHACRCLKRGGAGGRDERISFEEVGYREELRAIGRLLPE